MKRSERHHLKANPLAVAIGSMQGRLHEWSRGLTIGIAIGLGVLVVYGGYSWWSARTATQAGVLLAEALLLADAPVVPPPPPPVIEPTEPTEATEAIEPTGTDTTDTTGTAENDAAADAIEALAPLDPIEFVQPDGTYPTIEAKMSAALPKLIETADAYPGTPSGVTARYRAAAALATLGRHNDAVTQYEMVIGADPTGVYGRMATLGLADVQMARGAYDEAIVLLEQSTGAGAEVDLPVDGVLMRLGHAYDLAGRSEDAEATFQRVMDEFPRSFYLVDAERQLEILQTEG